MVDRGKASRWREVPVSGDDSKSLMARRVLVVRQSPSPVSPRFRRAPPSPRPRGSRHHRRSSPMRLLSSDPDEFCSSEEGDSTKATVTSSEDDDLRDPMGGCRPHSHVPELSSIKEVDASMSGSLSASLTIEALLRPTANDAGGPEARVESIRFPDVVSSPSLSLLIGEAEGFAGLDCYLARFQVEAGGIEGEEEGAPAVAVGALRRSPSDGHPQPPLPLTMVSSIHGSVTTGSEKQVIEDSGEVRLGFPSRAGGQVALRFGAAARRVQQQSVWLSWWAVIGHLLPGSHSFIGTLPRRRWVLVRLGKPLQLDRARVRLVGAVLVLLRVWQVEIKELILHYIIFLCMSLVMVGGEWRLAKGKGGAQASASRVEQVSVLDRAVTSPAALTSRFEALQSMGEIEPEEEDRMEGSKQEQLHMIE
ncbi:hypothetical protein Dimus_020157 [Dionaea muscipula]